MFDYHGQARHYVRGTSTFPCFHTNQLMNQSLSHEASLASLCQIYRRTGHWVFAIRQRWSREGEEQRLGSVPLGKKVRRQIQAPPVPLSAGQGRCYMYFVSNHIIFSFKHQVTVLMIDTTSCHSPLSGLPRMLWAPSTPTGRRNTIFYAASGLTTMIDLSRPLWLEKTSCERPSSLNTCDRRGSPTMVPSKLLYGWPCDNCKLN